MSARTALFMGIAGPICMLVGWGFTFVGVDKLHRAMHSTAKPIEITAAQLRSYRPGSNIHITLTKFVPYPEGILAYEGEVGPEWSIWVPVLPADAPKADPKYIVAVVQLSHVSDKTSLRKALARSRWTGILHSQGELEPYAKNICQLNPGINFEKCWVMWEGHPLEDASGAIPMVIACPCLFVLGMVLAVVTALRPVTALTEGSIPTVNFQNVASSAIGDGLRWLHRRGYLSGYTAFLMAAVGHMLIGASVFMLHRDWDHVVRMTAGMMIAITVGLIGLGLLVNAVVLTLASRKDVPTLPAPSQFQLANVDKPPADVKQSAGSVMAVGVGLLFAAGLIFYRGDNETKALVVGALGLLTLTVGGVWHGFLRSRGRQEQAQFWN